MRANLRHTLNWLNTFGFGDQLISVPALTEALERLTPSDVIERVNWLFVEGWVRLPSGERGGYQNHEQAITDARKQTARDLLDNLSLADVLNYGEILPLKPMFGHALATAIRDENEDAAVLDAVIERLKDKPDLLRGYAIGRVGASGRDWVTKQIERIQSKGNYSPVACAAIYGGLPEGIETWTAVSQRGSEVEAAYWKWASGYARPSVPEGASMAVEKLLDADRPEAALAVAGSPGTSIPAPLIQRLLRALISISPERLQIRHDATMFEYYLTNVFNQLYKSSDLPIEEIAKLEWPFAQVFDRFHRRERAPLVPSCVN